VARSTYDKLDAEELLLGDFRPFHIALARHELGQVRAGGAWKKYQTYTDNRFAKPIEQVKLFGKIEFASEGMGEVIRFIWNALNDASVKIWHEGGYHDALRMYVPGRGTFEGFEQVPEDAIEVHFYSLAPYARKIELGQSPAARTGVFKPAYSRAKSLYGRSVQLTYSYTVPRDGGSVLRSNRKPSKRGGGAYHAPVPSPVIYLKQGAFFQ
jgi:hypothetical protein